MYFVYALKSINHNWIYVGMTDNPDRRFAQHQNRENTSTKAYAPFFKFHAEQFSTPNEARPGKNTLKQQPGNDGLGKYWKYLKEEPRACLTA
jgi:putative endonuclease